MYSIKFIFGILFALVQGIIFGCASYRIAEEKDRRSMGYFWLGFILGVYGMAIALSLKSRHVNLPDYGETEDYIKKLSK